MTILRHRARQVTVWLLVLAMVLLITGLKLSAPDLDAYKRLVFGEGGLVGGASAASGRSDSCELADRR